MFEFLVETYAPDVAALRAEDAALAAEQVRQEGAQIRFLRAIFVPEDEISFYLFQASSADAVRLAMTRAGVRPDRITKAVSETNPTRFAEG